MLFRSVEHLRWWFLTLAAIYAFMTSAGQHTMRRARLDGENDAFFRRIGPARLQDFVPSTVVVVVLVALGLGLGWTGHRGPGAFVAVILAFAMLAWQLWMMDHFWRQTMDLPAGEDPSAPPE